MAYGRTNERGKPSVSEAIEMVRVAAEAGVKVFDTARSYGDSEKVLGLASDTPGRRFRVVTKLAPARNHAVAEVDASILRSLQELRCRRLDTVLLHRGSELTSDGGVRWLRLTQLRNQGLIQHLGVSVQTPEELGRALATPDVEVIQMPLNLLDRRWDEIIDSGALAHVEVHVRSVFLQGLLLTDDLEAWPKIKGLDTSTLMTQLDAFVSSFGRRSRADLCVAYVRAFPAVRFVVLGVARTEQLAENLRLFDTPTLTHEQKHQIRETFADIDHRLIDPSLWPPTSRVAPE